MLDNFVTLASTIGVTQSTGISTNNAQSNDNQESNQEKALLCTDKDLSWKERCILYDDVQIQDARAKIQPTMLDMKYNDVTPYNICKVLLAKDEVIDKKTNLTMTFKLGPVDRQSSHKDAEIKVVTKIVTRTYLDN